METTFNWPRECADFVKRGNAARRRRSSQIRALRIYRVYPTCTRYTRVLRRRYRCASQTANVSGTVTTTTAVRLQHGEKHRSSLRLARPGTTDELWPMNVLAYSTRPWRREHALFERGARMHGWRPRKRPRGGREFRIWHERRCALPPAFGSSLPFPSPLRFNIADESSIVLLLNVCLCSLLT